MLQRVERKRGCNAGTLMDWQTLLADIDRMFGWIPSWFVGLTLVLGAILIALSIYRLSVWLFNRAFGNPPPARERVHRPHRGPNSAGPQSCRRSVGAAARAAGRRLPHAADAPVRRRLHCADRLDLDPDRGYERGTVSPELSRRHREFCRAQARHPGPRLQARHRYHHRHHHGVDRADDIRLGQAIRRQPVRLRRCRRYHRWSCRPAAAEQSDRGHADRNHPADPH
ncbi:hypothetical protein ACVWZK_006341 [Bradyrhizobium sp. GM0.4]